MFVSVAGASNAAFSLASLWASYGPGESLARDLFTGVAGLGLIVGYGAGAIAFCMWLHRVVRQLNGIGIDVGVTPGWAVGYWFVPFINLVKPYRIVRTIVASLDEVLLSRLALRSWWAAWILANVLDNASARSATFSAIDVMGGLVGAIAAFLCVRIVRSIQAHLEVKRGELSRLP